eukprot:gene8198-8390_t
MDDPTVTHVFHAAIRSGLFSTVVRYNMRGAGASKAKWSKASLLGEPDVDDLLAVCQYVTTQLQNAPVELFMIGYSYGACVAANSLAQVPQVVGYVGIGFPLGGAANLALRSRHHWALLSDSAIPKLLIHGTQDKFGALSILRSYAAEYHDRQPQPGPLDLQIIDGADHFFDCKWQEVADKVISWVSSQADQTSGGSA